MKRCSKCGQYKPRTEFYKNYRNKDDCQDRCKDCEKEYNRSKGGRERKRKYANKIPGIEVPTFDF